MVQIVDLDFVYSVSLHKLHSFQTTRGESDGLRKLVLLNNFVFKKFVLPEQGEPLEWSEDDIKKDEESWLDACLDGLDEEEEGFVYVNKPPEYHQPPSSTVAPFPIDHYDNPQNYEDNYDYAMECKEHSHEEQPSKSDNVIEGVIIPHDLLHLPFFDPGGSQDSSFRIVIDEEPPPPPIEINNNKENISNDIPSEELTCEKGFHPYWKDNSIIERSSKPSSFHPYFNLNTRSFGIPKIFHKYLLGQDGNISSSRRIVPSSAFLELLQPDDPYQSLECYNTTLKRSKDDLDILYPRDLDQGILMDMIGMLEYYGGKKNEKKSNSSENNDIWFVGNHDVH